MPQVDERGHQPVDEDQLVPSARTRGPLSRPASYVTTAAFDRGLPRLGQLLCRTTLMTPGNPGEEPMREDRPSDLDRHTDGSRHPPTADASPDATHQLVRTGRRAAGGSGARTA